MFEFIPIGQNIQWFPHADRKNKPCPAVIQDVDPRSGIASVSIIKPMSSVLIYKTGVRHMGDPDLDKTEARFECGGWDLFDLPESGSLVTEPIPEPESIPEPKNEAPTLTFGERMAKFKEAKKTKAS